MLLLICRKDDVVLYLNGMFIYSISLYVSIFIIISCDYIQNFSTRACKPIFMGNIIWLSYLYPFCDINLNLIIRIILCSYTYLSMSWFSSSLIALGVPGGSNQILYFRKCIFFSKSLNLPIYINIHSIQKGMLKFRHHTKYEKQQMKLQKGAKDWIFYGSPLWLDLWWISLRTIRLLCWGTVQMNHSFQTKTDAIVRIVSLISRPMPEVMVSDNVLHISLMKS